MKRITIFFCFFIGLQPAFAQDVPMEKIRYSVDSLMQLIGQTKDEDSQVRYILNLYNTKVESYPLMVIETAQKLSLSAQKTHSQITEASSWSFYGQGYRLTGNYIKGLECHHKAVALSEKTGNKALLAIAQNQMGHIYKDREENEKALRLYQTARDNAVLGKNEETIIWPMMNLGAIYLAMNQIDSSLYYSKQAYDKSIQLNVIRNQPYILMNIASAFSKRGNNAETMHTFSEALTAADESQSIRFKNLIYEALAEHYLRNHQPDSSAYFAKRAITTVKNSVFVFLSMKPSKLLTDIYENSNADSTLKYLKIYRAANDSLFSARANQQLQMMTFEEDQRQQELATEKSKYQNKIKTNILLGVLTTILLIALILFRNNKQKQKANFLLHRQKEEIQSALSQLKSTQSQLIQSEKMASLGELTAGIAHEIQNPLNFVNNFSEVNKELLTEMNEELDKGNYDEVKAIAKNVTDNEEKIMFHGKRADSIVKGMLQHSRSSNGVKEPTDINALADEYLRLAYHGLRAKDKSFNASMKTEYDENIGLINIVPQDIGRVILNLITNAFYAVCPPPPEGGLQSSKVGYEPTVILTTRKWNSPLGDLGVEIIVKDNGNGIPSKVLDKIFQPFFTTKPTGQGTGLGLSLSYDIVKAHGGELKVETKEGEGTTFIIQLPA
ncbi:MAG: ATP-binding protein [Saprospiraceae bacterium]